MAKRRAIIIGAGPAGLTAAYELLQKTDIMPVILEMSDMVGGLAKTVMYKGNRIDIGGHRFFSKSEKILAWWEAMLPLQKGYEGDALTLGYQNKSVSFAGLREGSDPNSTDEVMLVRRRRSRIYFSGAFFEYPLTLTWHTIRNLGIYRSLKIGTSYCFAILFPRKEKSLEDFLMNRFGNELYRTFFKEYTEKVWGIPCNEIAPEWGAQRIKSLSLTKALKDAVLRPLRRGLRAQKETETSLIQQFLYPKFGPGQLWEIVARNVRSTGGELYFHEQVVALEQSDESIIAVITKNGRTGERKRWEADFFFSTMPVRELIAGLPEAPKRIGEIAGGLCYRDFMVIGLLVKKLMLRGKELNDNWIYIQDHGVRMGRIQIFNNWSPFLVATPDTVWLGCEYFCTEGDELWRKTDDEMRGLAIQELIRIGLLQKDDVIDGTVIREKKAYPAYTGTYGNFPILQMYLNGFKNLYCIGRNGMHRYNNQDHSMLTAMEAVDHILRGGAKEDIWNVNADSEYHEQQKTHL